MKKKVFSFLCALLCIMHAPAFAQVPGYMGKRFSVHYDPQFMYAFIASQHFDVHHNFSLEYVTSLRHVVGVRYGFSNLKDELEYSQQVYDSWGYYNTEYMEAPMRDKIHAFTVFVKFFSKRQGYIAPAGAYTAFGLCFFHSKAVMEQDINDDGTHYSEGDVIQTDNNYALYFGRGRQFIIAQRVVLNIGAQLGLPLIYRFGSTSGTDLHERALLSYIFRAQIGIGFLAF